MAEVGSAELVIIPSFKGGQRALEKELAGSSTKAMGSAGKASGNAFVGGLKSVVGPAAAIVGAGVAVDFAKDSIAAASDLGESLNALDVVFGDTAESIQAIGESAASNLGLSNLDFNNLSVQFSGFVKTVAGDGGDVVSTLDDLTTRAADFASVMNLDVAEAASLFQSGLAGESEPLRRYSIDLSAAAVDAYAYANGIAEVGTQLTEAQKVQARYGLLMQETEQTAGDFANTSDSLANQQRTLAAEWDNMQAELGTALLPVMQDVTGWLIETGLPGLQQFTDDLDDPSTTIGGIAASLGDLFTELEPSLTTAFEFGGTFAEAFFGGLAGAFELYDAGGWSGLWSGWLDGATEFGSVLSEWGDYGGNFAQEFVAGIDTFFYELEINGWGGIWDDWLGGVDGLTQDFGDWMDTWWPGGKTPRGQAIDNAANAASADVHLQYDITSFQSDVVDSITAAADANWGAPVVNIGTVVADDPDEIVRKAQKASRANSWSGSRNGPGIDPRLTR